MGMKDLRRKTVAGRMKRERKKLERRQLLADVLKTHKAQGLLKAIGSGLVRLAPAGFVARMKSLLSFRRGK